jgi:ribonuclease E
VAPRERQEVQANAVAAESASVNVNADMASTAGAPDAARNEVRSERTGRSRGERRPRGPRPGEETRLDDAGNVIQTTTGEAATAAADEMPGEVDQSNRPEAAPREKRSRDRYGRDRKPRGERAERNDAEAEPSALAPEGAATAAQDEVDVAPRKSYFTAPVVNLPVDGGAATSAAEPVGVPAIASTDITAPAADAAVAVTAASAPAPAAAVLAAPAAAVVTPRTAPTVVAAPSAAIPGMPTVQAYALPVDMLKQVAQQSGLAWVNSDAAKVAAAQAAMAAEPQPVHVPRQRPAPIIQDDKPLVLVETKRDLRKLTLPFEQAEASGQPL